jgi:hypothetical protein
MAKQEGQYIKIKADANKDERSEIIKRLNANELKWAYFALEGEVRYQYYMVLTK